MINEIIDCSFIYVTVQKKERKKKPYTSPVLGRSFNSYVHRVCFSEIYIILCVIFGVIFWSLEHLNFISWLIPTLTAVPLWYLGIIHHSGLNVNCSPRLLYVNTCFLAGGTDQKGCVTFRRWNPSEKSMSLRVSLEISFLKQGPSATFWLWLLCGQLASTPAGEDCIPFNCEPD